MLTLIFTRAQIVQICGCYFPAFKRLEITGKATFASLKPEKNDGDDDDDDGGGDDDDGVEPTLSAFATLG